MWTLVFTLMIGGNLNIQMIETYDSYNECFQVRKALMPELQKWENLNCIMVKPSK